MSIIARRLEEGIVHSAGLLGRRSAFKSAAVAISKICEGSETDAESGSERSYANSLDEATPIELGKEVAVDQEAFEELFGDDIVYWISVRAESYGAYELTRERAQLLGLTEAKRIEYAGTSEIIEHQEGCGFGSDIQEVSMIVPADRIFYFSGEASVKRSLPKGAESIELQPGCFYGSTMEERRIGSTNADPKWHALLMYTLKRRSRREEVTGSSEVLTVLEDVGGALECTLSCTEKPNHVWRSDAPWNRPPSEKISSYFDKSERIFCRSSSFECAKSAVLNGIALLAGRDYASEDWEKSKSYTVGWLCTEAVGVLILNLIGTGGFNHMVCVDLRDTKNKKIHDCLEDHPVKLSEESLQCCIGDGIQLTHVYARKLCKTAGADMVITGKRKRSRNRNARRKAARVSGN